MTIPLDHAIGLMHAGRGVGSALMANAALELEGATTDWVGQRLGVVSVHDRQILIDGSIGNETAVGATIVRDKILAKQLLATHGVASPRGEGARSADHAVQILRKFNRPAVVKPQYGARGKGVSVDVRSATEMREAYEVALAMGRGKPLVEDYIDIAEEYRCMATSTDCVAVVQRVLPKVRGDGTSTIRELITAKNDERRENPALMKLLIPVDPVVDRVLSRQGVDLDTILPQGQPAVVRNVGGLSGGAEPHEVSQTVDPAVKALAPRAVEAIADMKWGGVDIVTEKGSGKPYVLEVNSSAGFGAATFPLGGTPNDVASAMWRERISLSVPDPTEAPTIPSLIRDPMTLQQAFPELWGAADEMDLSVLFFSSMKRAGVIMERYGEVVRVAFPGGTAGWFGRDASTQTDLFAVRRLIRQHVQVRKVLRRARTPLWVGRPIKNTGQLEKFVRNRAGKMIVLPIRAQWGRPNSRVVDVSAALDVLNLGTGVFVQERPAGTRLRVFATRQRVLAVTASSASTSKVTGDFLEKAGAAAVRALRGIPELPWAAVDIHAGAPYRNTRTLRVEGLAANPQLRGEDHLVAGSLQALFESLLGRRLSTSAG